MYVRNHNFDFLIVSIEFTIINSASFKQGQAESNQPRNPFPTDRPPNVPNQAIGKFLVVRPYIIYDGNTIFRPFAIRPGWSRRFNRRC